MEVIRPQHGNRPVTVGRLNPSSQAKTFAGWRASTDFMFNWPKHQTDRHSSLPVAQTKHIPMYQSPTVAISQVTITPQCIYLSKNLGRSILNGFICQQRHIPGDVN